MMFFITLFSMFLILFLPGYIWSFVFFKKNAVDSTERLALSFALSVALVPIVTFYTNIFGLRITMITVSIQTLLVMLCAVLVLVVKKYYES